MKTLIKRFYVILLFLAAIIGLNSCGVHNKLSSPSRPHYQKAKDYWKDGYKLAALNSASSGVLADPVYTNSKEFLYEHYDQTMQNIKQELNRYKNTKDTAAAVRRLYIYQTLVQINEKIAKMNMPLKHHKNKWKWSAEPVDYTAEAAEAKSSAYQVFYDFAVLTLKSAKNRGDVKNANSIFSKGHFRYLDANSEERKKSLENFTNELFAFADGYKDSDNWVEAIMAADAFKILEGYQVDVKRANEGYEYTALRVSKLLTEEGKKLTEKGDLQALLDADGFYKNAIDWNSENEEAKKLKEELKPKIAEGYYQKAKKMDQQANADLEQVKKLYEEALKWVPGYKDCQARIYSVSVRYELIALEENIEGTQKEFDIIYGRVKTVSEGVNTANSVIQDMVEIVENLKKLDKTLHTVSLTMKPLNLIPYVNVVSKSIDVSAKTVRIPVHRSVQTITPLENKAIRPTGNASAKLKFYTDMTVNKMGTTQKVLINSKKTAAALQTCIHKVEDEEALKQSERAIKELNKGLVEVQKKLNEINSYTNDLVRTANKLIGISQFTAPVKSGVDALKPSLDNVYDVTKEIDKVLDKEFLGVSARKALSIGGAAGDLAMKAMKPLLDKMNISLPEIPGLAELEAEMAKLEAMYEDIKKTTDEYKAKYDEYSDVQAHINRNLNILVEKTGCGVGVESFEPDGVYKIKSPYYNKYWDVSGRGSSTNKNGVNVQMWSMDSGQDRLVKFIPAGGELFFIEFQNGGRVLDVSGGNTLNGTNIQIWEKNGSDAQKFALVPIEGKKDVYAIINVNSGKAVDGEGDINKNGANIHLWEHDKGNKTQHWQLVKVAGKQ